MTRLVDHWMGPGQCDCPEASLLRELVTSLDEPDGMLDRLASSLAVWKLRQMSHDLSAASDWSRAVLPWARRQEYDTPAASAEEIHARVSAAWEAWYRARNTEWLTECARQATVDTPHGRLILAILRERS